MRYDRMDLCVMATFVTFIIAGFYGAIEGLPMVAISCSLGCIGCGSILDGFRKGNGTEGPLGLCFAGASLVVVAVMILISWAAITYLM